MLPTLAAALTVAGVNQVVLVGYGSKAPTYMMRALNLPTPPQEPVIQNRFDIGKNFQLQKIPLFNLTLRGKVFQMLGLQDGSVMYRYTEFGNEVQVKVYPRLMHALKCLHSSTFAIPKTNKGVKLRFKKLKEIAYQMRYLRDSDLTGYRVEVVVRGCITLNEAHRVASAVLEESLPEGVVIADSITPRQYQKNLLRIIRRCEGSKVFRGRDKSAPTKGKKAASFNHL